MLTLEKRYRRKALIASFLILIALSFLIPATGEICGKNEHTGHEDCPSYHILLVFLWHVGKFLNDYGIAVTAIATVAIAAFTFILYRATNRQAGLTREAIADAKDTAKRQLRAYPGITGATIDLRGEQIQIAVKIWNYSPTPAYKFRHAIAHEFCEPEGGRVLREMPHKKMQWDMAPRSNTTMRSDGKITNEQTTAITDKKELVVIFYGRVDYEDAFGKPRSIEFRYRSAEFKRVHSEDGTNFLGHHCSEPEPEFYRSD